jgi:TonB family protein
MGKMQRRYLALVMLFIIPSLAAQDRRPGGMTGRNPLCAKLLTPKQVGDEMVYPVGNGVSPPVLVKGTKPNVPPDKASLKGVVIVCGVVAHDGRIHTAGIDRAIGNGLDEIALDTVKKWEFRPAMREGEPVAAPVSLQVKFGD